MLTLDPRARALVSLFVSGSILTGGLNRVGYLASIVLTPLFDARGATVVGALVLVALAVWSLLLVRGVEALEHRWLVQGAHVLAALSLAVTLLAVLATLTSDVGL